MTTSPTHPASMFPESGSYLRKMYGTDWQFASKDRPRAADLRVGHFMPRSIDRSSRSHPAQTRRGPRKNRQMHSPPRHQIIRVDFLIPGRTMKITTVDVEDPTKSNEPIVYWADGPYPAPWAGSRTSFMDVITHIPGINYFQYFADYASTAEKLASPPHARDVRPGDRLPPFCGLPQGFDYRDEVRKIQNLASLGEALLDDMNETRERLRRLEEADDEESRIEARRLNDAIYLWQYWLQNGQNERAYPFPDVENLGVSPSFREHGFMIVREVEPQSDGLVLIQTNDFRCTRHCTRKWLFYPDELVIFPRVKNRIPSGTPSAFDARYFDDYIYVTERGNPFKLLRHINPRRQGRWPDYIQPWTTLGDPLFSPITGKLLINDVRPKPGARVYPPRLLTMEQVDILEDLGVSRSSLLTERQCALQRIQDACARWTSTIINRRLTDVKILSVPTTIEEALELSFHPEPDDQFKTRTNIESDVERSDPNWIKEHEGKGW